MIETLTSRITLKGNEPDCPEDYLSTCLGVIFPDDIMNQHGDAEHSLVYESPHLPKPLLLDLAVPDGDEDRRLFSHYLWNASLLLAELIERDTLKLDASSSTPDTHTIPGTKISFDVNKLSIVELGAGTALPSMMASLLGASSVVVTDYPAPALLHTLRINVDRNTKPELSPTPDVVSNSVVVDGHEWGSFSDHISTTYKHSFDRVIVSDCLWMPWQHKNLHQSIVHFLKVQDLSARAWVCAGFHTGREKMRLFFDKSILQEAGLEVEDMWERDCDGVQREWSWSREDDITERKRWLVVAVLKRLPV